MAAHHQQSIAQDDSREGEKTADNRDTVEVAVDKEMNKEIQEPDAVSVSNEAETRRLTSLESAAQTASLHWAPLDAAPATPTKQVDDAVPSPRTEEIHREKIPTSLESVSSSPTSTISSPSTELTSLRDMTLEAARIMHGFSKYQKGFPKEVHSMILQTLR